MNEILGDGRLRYDPDFGNLWDNHCTPVQKQPHISKMCKHGYAGGILKCPLPSHILEFRAVSGLFADAPQSFGRADVHSFSLEDQ